MLNLYFIVELSGVVKITDYTMTMATTREVRIFTAIFIVICSTILSRFRVQSNFSNDKALEVNHTIGG